jgi:hypothetical protein
MKHSKSLTAAILTIAVLLSYGCGMSTAQIETQLKDEIQQTLKQSADFGKYNMQVTRVDVVHKNKNEYKGSAQVTFKGTNRNIPIDVIVNKRSLYWEIPGAAFMFVAQWEMENYQTMEQQLEKSFLDFLMK